MSAHEAPTTDMTRSCTAAAAHPVSTTQASAAPSSLGSSKSQVVTIQVLNHEPPL